MQQSHDTTIPTQTQSTDNEMEVRSVSKGTSTAPQSQSTDPKEPFHSSLWKGLCNLFTGLLRPREHNELQQLREELLITKTKNSCLEQELARKKQDHQLQKEYLNSFFDAQVKAHQQSVNLVLDECMAELNALYNRHDTLKGQHAVLDQAYRKLQKDANAIEKHIAALQEINAGLMQKNQKLAAENANLMEQRKWDEPLVRKAYQSSQFAKFALR